MKITLNLATKPYADQGPAIKRLRQGMAIAAGLLLLLGLGMLHFHQRAQKMRKQEDAAQAAVTHIRHEQTGYRAQMQLPPNARVLTQAEFLNNLFAEKAFSWTAAMEDLERVLPPGEQVTAIEPSRGKDGRLTLKLRISGARERAVEMVRNMEKSQRFSSPRVSGESAETSNGPGMIQNAAEAGKTNFDLLAEYNPPTLEERKAEIAAQKSKKTGAIAPAPAAAARPVPPMRGLTNPGPANPVLNRPLPNQVQPPPGLRPTPGANGAPQYMSPMRGQSRMPGIPPRNQNTPQQPQPQENPQ